MAGTTARTVTVKLTVAPPTPTYIDVTGYIRTTDPIGAFGTALRQRRIYDPFHAAVSDVIDQRLPMSELQSAYARMGSRQVRGKLVLAWGNVEASADWSAR